MKKIFLLFLFLLPFTALSQTWADDSQLDEIVNNKSAFGDDESSIVIIEFWASFNEAMRLQIGINCRMFNMFV